jgi:TolB protein
MEARTGIVKRLAVLTATLFLLAACSAKGGQSPASSPGPATSVKSSTSPVLAGRIVFTLDSLDSKGTRLYTAAPDGGDRQILTDFGVEDPDWSPDGSMIAFDSERAGHTHIFIIDADGTGLRQITSGKGYEGHPSWSPDGTYLAMDWTFDDHTAGISAVNVADGSMTNITTNPYGEPGVDASPQYSDDGARIVFVRGREVGTAVFVVDVDGSDLRRITPWNMTAGHPWWSPDGTRIVFYDSVRIPDDQHIFVVNADGTGLQQLTDGHEEGDFHPSWSPDGQEILFTRYTFVPRSELFALYTMKPDGSEVRLLYKTLEGDLNDVSLAPAS